MSISVACNQRELRSGTCAGGGDSNVVSFISFTDSVTGDVRKLYSPVYADFRTSDAYFYDMSGNSVTLVYADSDKTRAELETLLTECCGCFDAGGPVTSVTSDNATPLFNVNVANPTTTPHFSYTFNNISQYQVWGRVAAGSGQPSFVTLSPVAFTGIAEPDRQIVYGTGIGVDSSANFKYTTAGGIQLGTGTNLSAYTVNIGSATIDNKTLSSLIFCDNNNTYTTGSGNKNLALIAGGSSNVINADYDAYGSVMLGEANTITANSTMAIFNSIIGNENTIVNSYHNKIIGSYNTISNTSASNTSYSNFVLGTLNTITQTTTGVYYNHVIGVNNQVTDGSYYNFMFGTYANSGGKIGCGFFTDGRLSVITAVANNTFNARFYGGYRFMQDGSTQWMAIANTGYVTINNIPTASTDNLLISNGGVVSTRLVSTLPFTNNAGTVTSVGATISGALSVTGSPITTAGTLAFSWTGTAAQYIKGDGTLGTLPPGLDAQTLSWTANISNLSISGGNSVNLFSLTSLAANDLLKWNGTDWVNFTPTWTSNTGTVTSVAATVTASTALTVSGSPITTAGTLAFSWTGAVTDSVRGDGTLKPFPTIPATLDDLTDVVITTPATGDLLQWNGTNWVDWTPNYLTSLAHVHYVANSTGTNQFSFGVNEAVRFAAGTDIGVTFDSGTKKVTIAYTGSGGSSLPVWKVQGGTTNATTNTENIYHNAKVAVGDYSGSVSSYQLAVSGQTYSTTGVVINNNQYYKAFNTGGTAVNVAGFNSSNQTVLGNTGYDILLPAYPNTRTDSFYTVPAVRLLYTDSTGKLLLTDKKAFYNDHASAATETQAGVTAGGGWYRLPNNSAYNTNSYYTQFNHNSTNNDVQIPRGDQIFHVLVTVEWEMQSGGSGTPYVQFQIRLNNSTTGVKTPNWYFYATGYKFTTTFQSIVQATGSGMYDIAVYCNVASGTGSIYINRSVKMVTNVGYQLT